jgi:hypothetical protein
VFSLPELEPPDSIKNKTVPPDNDALVTEVLRFLEPQRTYCLWPIVATIPFYSDIDPHVYVLVHSGGKCERGIASYSRGSFGRWEFGRFIPDVPIQQLTRIIEKIESNTALTLSP